MAKEKFVWKDCTNYAHWLANIKEAVEAYNRLNRYKYRPHRKLAEQLAADIAAFEKNENNDEISNFAAKVNGILIGAKIKQRGLFKSSEDSFMYALKQKALVDFFLKGAEFAKNEKKLYALELQKSLKTTQESNERLKESAKLDKVEISKLRSQLSVAQDTIQAREELIVNLRSGIKGDPVYNKALQQLEKLREEFSILQSQYNEAEKKHEQMLKDFPIIESQNQELKQTNSEMESKLKELEEAKGKITLLEEEKNNLQIANKSHELTIEHLKEQLPVLSNKVVEQSERIAELENNLREKDKQLEVATEKNKVVDSLNEANVALNSKKIEVSENNKKLIEENDALKKELEEAKLDKDLKGQVTWIFTFLKKLLGEKIVAGSRQVTIDDKDAQKLNEILSEEKKSAPSKYSFWNLFPRKVSQSVDYPSAEYNPPK